MCFRVFLTYLFCDKTDVPENERKRKMTAKKNNKKEKNNNMFTIYMQEYLNMQTAPGLEKKLATMPDNTKCLVFDFTNLKYITPSGMRAVLSAQKEMNKKAGKTKIVHVGKEIMDIFEVTGFASLMNIECS